MKRTTIIPYYLINCQRNNELRNLRYELKHAVRWLTSFRWYRHVYRIARVTGSLSLAFFALQPVVIIPRILVTIVKSMIVLPLRFLGMMAQPFRGEISLLTLKNEGTRFMDGEMAKKIAWRKSNSLLCINLETVLPLSCAYNTLGIHIRARLYCTSTRRGRETVTGFPIDFQDV